MEDTRRTQAARSAETREALIAAARPLFAEHGFADVALETVVRAAGVTRGALYHHFTDKTELFAAVYERIDGEMAARTGAAIAATGQTDPLEMMRLAVGFWLDACSDPEVQRIVLVEGPAVLGWARWNEVGNRYNIDMVQDLIANAITAGCIPPQPVEATALTLLGAMREATLFVARAQDRDQARTDAAIAMDRMIDSLNLDQKS
jgi:AcrR family transcriptional regulator